jgi:hypothetical protein
LSGCARWKLKKARAGASEAGTGGTQQPGNASMPKQGETSTESLKRPRSEGSNPTETARVPKRLRNSSGPGTYMEAVTNIKISIFWETYPEDRLMEDNQDCILEELGRVLSEVLQAGWRCIYIACSTCRLIRRPGSFLESLIR